MCWVRCVCLVALLLTFVACERVADPTAACESFTLLRPELGNTFALDEFADWVAKEYSLRQLKEIEVKSYSHIDASFSWLVNGYKYRDEIEDGVFTRLNITKEGSGEMRVRDLITCFGQPQFYYALHDVAIEGQDYQDFDLFFPSTGVIMLGYRLYSSASRVTRPITDDFPVLRFIILQPGTVDEMLMQVYGNTTPYEYGAIRPWPETWEEIEIDITPYLQRLKDAP